MMIPTFLVAAALMVVAVGCKPPAPPTVNIDDTEEVEGGSNTTAAVETPSNTTAVVETPAAE
ncbi:secreted protein [Rhodopirellula maiorica SM1]|uniref:Secreted protein n=2 Tax=Novipirellula TaxID=2795426 RepID=M5RWB9_9BACT|nr:secreted protein [Rhodopirellula maiorica SM1]